MKVQVSFTVDVDYVDEDAKLSEAEILEAVKEAVFNALSKAETEGHVHQHEDKVAILMDSEVVVSSPE